jgi:hypothetical protein
MTPSLTPVTAERIARAVSKAARYCSTEKAISLVAMNTPYSIAQVRAALEMRAA